MTTKFLRLNLKGEPSVDDIHAAAGEHGGEIVRTHTEGGETRVYIAVEATKSPAPKMAAAAPGAAAAEEVDASEAMQIG